MRVFTCLFMLGTAWIDLRGLKTRIIRKDFRFGTSGIRVISPVITIKKSNTFQPSLKYERLCITRPKANIFMMHSMV